MILYFSIFIKIITSASNKCKAGELIIPRDTKIIENNEYKGCNKYTGSLIIPNSVEKISKYAFYGCSGLNGTLTVSENIKEIEEYAFGETNFESINFLVENIICSSNAFTNVPKVTVKNNYKDDYICGIQIRKSESNNWFKNNLTLVLCIAIPVIIIVIIVIIASCMKKTPYDNNNKTTNQSDLSSTNTINEIQNNSNTYNHEKPKTSTNAKEISVIDDYYNDQMPSGYWSDIDEKQISDNELTESVNSKSSNGSQIKTNDHQSTLEDSSPLSIHESNSDLSLSSRSE